MLKLFANVTQKRVRNISDYPKFISLPISVFSKQGCLGKNF